MVAVASAYTLQGENSGIEAIDALDNGFHLAFIGMVVATAVAEVVALAAIKNPDPSGQKDKAMAVG